MAQVSKPNPQIVKDEILEHLRREGVAVYHVEPEMWPNDRSVWWDTNRVPDYKKFLATAKSAGAKVILYFDQDLTEETIADAEDALELATLEPDEFREYARRIGELRSYIGFTNRLGIGYASEGFFYWYDLEAPWYEELMEMLEELQLSQFPFSADPGFEEDDDDDDDQKPPLGNYFSKN